MAAALPDLDRVSDPALQIRFSPAAVRRMMEAKPVTPMHPCRVCTVLTRWLRLLARVFASQARPRPSQVASPPTAREKSFLTDLSGLTEALRIMLLHNTLVDMSEAVCDRCLRRGGYNDLYQAAFDSQKDDILTELRLYSLSPNHMPMLTVYGDFVLECLGDGVPEPDLEEWVEEQRELLFLVSPPARVHVCNAAPENEETDTETETDTSSFVDLSEMAAELPDYGATAEGDVLSSPGATDDWTALGEGGAEVQGAAAVDEEGAAASAAPQGEERSPRPRDPTGDVGESGGSPRPAAEARETQDEDREVRGAVGVAPEAPRSRKTVPLPYRDMLTKYPRSRVVFDETYATVRGLLWKFHSMTGDTLVRPLGKPTAKSPRHRRQEEKDRVNCKYCKMMAEGLTDCVALDIANLHGAQFIDRLDVNPDINGMELDELCNLMCEVKPDCRACYIWRLIDHCVRDRVGTHLFLPTTEAAVSTPSLADLLVKMDWITRVLVHRDAMRCVLMELYGTDHCYNCALVSGNGLFHRQRIWDPDRFVQLFDKYVVKSEFTQP